MPTMCFWSHWTFSHWSWYFKTHARLDTCSFADHWNINKILNAEVLAWICVQKNSQSLASNLPQNQFQSNYTFLKLNRSAQINFAVCVVVKLNIHNICQKPTHSRVSVKHYYIIAKLLSSYVYDLITDRSHFKDQRDHFKLPKRYDKQRTMSSPKTSIRLQNNKLSLKKNIRLKALIPAENEEMNFLYKSNLLKGP